MTKITTPRTESPSPKLIALWWHTAHLAALFLGMGASGALGLGVSFGAVYEDPGGAYGRELSGLCPSG
jgi:hypothetical protein